MTRQAIVAATCCFTCEDACYCGTLCVGCASSCVEGDENVCMSAAEWDGNIGDVPGTGSGLLVEIGGLWYFFDGASGDCANVVAPRLIDWDSAYRADECPDGCERTLTITWTGSVSYSIPCCVAIPGPPDQYYFDSAGTGTQSAKESPEMTLDSSCLDQNENTDLEYMVAGDSCGESYLSEMSAQNFRLNFRLERDDVDCVWVIRVRGGGTVPGNVPNEAAGTNWELRWTAPLSLCPPESGWTLDEAGSTLPLEIGSGCDWPFGFVTEFTVGTVSVGFLTP